MTLILMSLVCAAVVFAQDPHFSQFYSSPLTLNPAFTGKFNGDLRIVGNYRNQWPTINNAYTTFTASADFGILKNRIAQNDTWGIGIMALTDQSANGAVSYSYAALSTAYHKSLDENGFKQLGLGFQASYSNMNIYVNKLTFEDQLAPDGTFSLPTAEQFEGSTLQKSYLDLNAGVLYTNSITEHDNMYVGVSMYHITRPEMSFLPKGFQTLNSRVTFQAGGYFLVSGRSTLHLSGMHSIQAGANETLLGGALQLPVGDADYEDKPVSVYIGGWARFKDAAIPYIGLDFSDFHLGATYDINTSQLKTASNSRGGVEISLLYIKQPPGSKGLPCPRF